MVWQRVRFVLVAGVLMAGAAVSARAEDQAAPAPATQTVTCTEWVPEQKQCTRTVYKTEYKQETYTAYRCECVPESRTYNVTVYKQVQDVKTVTRNYCVCVPTVEERTVMRAHVTCVPETKMVRKCVEKGHYECKEVPVCHPIKDCFKKLCHNDCCEPCCPPPTKTVRVWVPCPVYKECPVTCMKRVCEYRPEKIKVCVNKMETRQEQCQVTYCKCVPEQQTRTCTVMVTKKTPYQATRCVPVCVPHQETYTVCRMVPRTVTKQVPVCPAPCCETTCCKSHCHKWLHRCSGLHVRHSDCCD
jgi:hypothetical protein